MTEPFNQRKAVHVHLPEVDVAALDRLAQAKSEIEPTRWTRAACVREAVRLYVQDNITVGSPGSFRLLHPSQFETLESWEAAVARAFKDHVEAEDA